jgi:hypothetical protein
MIAPGISNDVFSSLYREISPIPLEGKIDDGDCSPGFAKQGGPFCKGPMIQS